MSINYYTKDAYEKRDSVYKYSPFRNLGPQKSYNKMNYNERRLYDNRIKYEGQIIHSAQGYDYEIVDYMNWHNVMVRFICDGYCKFADMNTVRKGLVLYPFKPNKFGGVIGVGYYNQGNSKNINSVWFKILERATPEFWSIPRFKKYEGTTVCPEWFNFQNFAFWYDCYISRLNLDIKKYNYQIDKDILQWGVKNKIYSPQTCCLVPKTLNASLECLDKERNINLPKGVDYLGPNRYSVRCSYGTTASNGKYLGTFETPEEAFQVYKREKEGYLKSLANKYYLEGAILKNVRDAVCNIEIKPYGI